MPNERITCNVCGYTYRPYDPSDREICPDCHSNPNDSEVLVAICPFCTNTIRYARIDENDRILRSRRRCRWCGNYDAANQAFHCSHCFHWFPYDRERGNNRMCTTCEDNYERCECGRFYNRGGYCMRCRIRCVTCGSISSRSEWSHNDGYCPNCPNPPVPNCTCAECRKSPLWHPPDLFTRNERDYDESDEYDEYDDDDDDDDCEDCDPSVDYVCYHHRHQMSLAGRRSRDASHVWNYSYKPKPKFKGEGPIYLGFELEVGLPGYRSESLQSSIGERWGDFAYMKEDCSVDGVEIVSHPLSLSWAIDNIDWDLLPDLSDGGAFEENEYGLHVHVSRKAFSSASHMFKWLKFIYRNEESMTRFSRRNSYYGTFDPKSRKYQKHIVKGGTPSVDRYNAVNVQNATTLEVRTFRTTLDPSILQATLGFMEWSVRYAEKLTANDILTGSGWNWSRMLEEASKNNSDSRYNSLIEVANRL